MERVDAKTKLLAKVDLKNDSEKYPTLEWFDELAKKVIAVDKGKNFDNDSEGIWLDRNFVEKNHLKLDDDVTLVIANQTIHFPIKGLVESADKIYFTRSIEYLAPNSKNYTYGYVPEKALAKMTRGHTTNNALDIYAKKGDIRHNIEEILGKHLFSYDNQKTLTEVSEATGRVGQIRNFSFIFIFLAILAMFTTIRRLIES